MKPAHHKFPALKPLLALISLIWMAALEGCPSTHEVQKPAPAVIPKPEKKPAAPEITFQFGSLDIYNHQGRIEQPSVDTLAGIIRREKIDVLAVQGIFRYPDLKTRIDFVDALSSSAELRSAFGETINRNGRQGGNAIFSLFPIKTTDNSHYVEMKGIGFEAALLAVIDCGVRDVVFVSTRLPENPGMGEETNAMSTFTSYYSYYIDTPIILSGNLPHVVIEQPPAAYRNIPLDHAGSTKIWCIEDSTLKVIQTKVDTTNFGRLAIVQFGLFGPKPR